MELDIQSNPEIQFKGYGFLSFVIDMCKSFSKYKLKGSMNKSFLTRQKKIATDAFKTASK